MKTASRCTCFSRCLSGQMYACVNKYGSDSTPDTENKTNNKNITKKGYSIVFKVALFTEVQFGRDHVLFFQTLDELTDNCRAQSTELVKTVSQHSQTKEEVCQIRCVCVRVRSCGFGCCCLFSILMLLICYHRTIVSELKEEVGRFSVRDREPVLSKVFPSSSFHSII